MKIQDVLRKDVMLLDLQATSKEAVIDEMIASLVDKGYVTDFEVFKTGILNREAQTTTGLGDGIAMPHAKNAAVKEATVLFAKSNKGVDYASLDGQPTDLFFMIAAPEGANDTHLAALAELSKYLMKPDLLTNFVVFLAQKKSFQSLTQLRQQTRLPKKWLQHQVVTVHLSLLLLHVQQVSPTLTWQKKHLRNKLLRWVLTSRLKPTVHQVLETN